VNSNIRFSHNPESLVQRLVCHCCQHLLQSFNDDLLRLTVKSKNNNPAMFLRRIIFDVRKVQVERENRSRLRLAKGNERWILRAPHLLLCDRDGIVPLLIQEDCRLEREILVNLESHGYAAPCIGRTRSRANSAP